MNFSIAERLQPLLSPVPKLNERTRHSFVQIIELFRNIVFCSIQLVVIAAAAVIFLQNVIIFPIDFFLCYSTLISIVAGLGWAGLGERCY